MEAALRGLGARSLLALRLLHRSHFFQGKFLLFMVPKNPERSRSGSFYAPVRRLVQSGEE